MVWIGKLKIFKFLDNIHSVSETYAVSNIYSQSKFSIVSSLNVVFIIAPTIQGSTSAVVSSCAQRSILLYYISKTKAGVSVAEWSR